MEFIIVLIKALAYGISATVFAVGVMCFYLKKIKHVRGFCVPTWYQFKKGSVMLFRTLTKI